MYTSISYVCIYIYIYIHVVYVYVRVYGYMDVCIYKIRDGVAKSPVIQIHSLRYQRSGTVARGNFKVKQRNGESIEGQCKAVQRVVTSYTRARSSFRYLSCSCVVCVVFASVA